LVMFSGVSPNEIQMAKNTKAKMIYGIEINKNGCKYAAENVKLNKITNVKLFCGDVRNILPKLKKFDRIAMPLPKGAYNFVELALKHIKPGGIIHYYDFLPEEQIPTTAVKRIAAAAKKLNKKIRVKKTVKCGQLAPRAYRVCVDFKVL